MKKIVFAFILLVTNMYSLEFGYMGNKSFGMGGSGVAVADSPWSAYYNPALQGLDSDIKFGISSGFRLNIPDINIDNSIKDNFSSKHPNISDILANVKEINTVLRNTTETGIALQIPIPTTSITSSIGLGAFYTTRSLIGISPNVTSSSTIRDNYSFQTDINSLSILELPVSYALGYSTFMGDFYLGVAGKYMLANHNLTTRVTNNINFLFSSDVIRPNGVITNMFGVDVGFAYNAPLNIITIGVVGKNLNQPSVNLKDGDHLKLESQYRLGISTSFIPLTTIALDIDLKPNKQFSYVDDVKHIILGNKTQIVSLGGIVSMGFFDIRAGVAKDLFSNRNDWLVSGGIGFTFIDIALYSSTKMSNVGGIKLPSNFGIKLGSSFSF